MDIFDLYADLEEFDLNQALKDKEEAYKELEKKYNEAIENVDKLGLECKNWKKKFKNTEKSFWSLLETCRAEIRRKDSELDALKKQRDDVIFRRISNRGQINENYLEKKTLKTDTGNGEPFSSDYRSKDFVKNKNTIPSVPHCNPGTSEKISQNSDGAKYEQTSKAVSTDTKRNESRNRKRYHPYPDASKDDLTSKNVDKNKVKNQRNEYRIVKETEERFRDNHQINRSSSNELGNKRNKLRESENTNQKSHITGNKNSTKIPDEKNKKLKKATNSLENKRDLVSDCKIASDSVSEMLKQIRMTFEKQNGKMETTKQQQNQNTEIYKTNKTDESEGYKQQNNAMKLKSTEKQKISKLITFQNANNFITSENKVSNSNTRSITGEKTLDPNRNENYIEKKKNFIAYNPTHQPSSCSVIENLNNSKIDYCDEKFTSNNSEKLDKVYSDEKFNKSAVLKAKSMTKENSLNRKVIKNDSYPNNFKIKIINFPSTKCSSNDHTKTYKIPKLNKTGEINNKFQISGDLNEEESSKYQVEKSNNCSLMTSFATNDKKSDGSLEINFESLNPNVKKNVCILRTTPKKIDDDLAKSIINESEDNIESKHPSQENSHNMEIHKLDTQNPEVISSAIASIINNVEETISSSTSIPNNLNYKATNNEIESISANIGSNLSVKSCQPTSGSSPKCDSNSINTETLRATEYLKENMMLILEGKPYVNLEAVETENVSNNQKTFKLKSEQEREDLKKNMLAGEIDSIKVNNDEIVSDSIQITENEIKKKMETDDSSQTLKKKLVVETKNSKIFLTKTKEKPRKIVSVPEKFINSRSEYQETEEKKNLGIKKQLEVKSRTLLSSEDTTKNCTKSNHKNGLLEKFNERSSKGIYTTYNDKNKSTSLLGNENVPSGNKQSTKKIENKNILIDKIKVKNNSTSDEDNNLISEIRKRKRMENADTHIYSSRNTPQEGFATEIDSVDETVMSITRKKRRMKIAETSDINSSTVEKNNSESNTELTDLNDIELDSIKNQDTPESSRKSVRIAKKIQVNIEGESKLEKKNNSDLQINKMSVRDEELFDCMFKSPNKNLMIAIPDNNLLADDQVEESFKKIFDSPLESQITTISEINSVTPETKLNNLETFLDVREKNIKDVNEIESETVHNRSIIKNISTTTSEYQLVIEPDENSQVDHSVTWLISRRKTKKKKK